MTTMRSPCPAVVVLVLAAAASATAGPDLARPVALHPGR